MGSEADNKDFKDDSIDEQRSPEKHQGEQVGGLMSFEKPTVSVRTWFGEKNYGHYKWLPNYSSLMPKGNGILL